MKATLPTKEVSNVKPSHRKENTPCWFYGWYIIDGAAKDPEPGTVVDVRLYGTGQRWYACIWVHADPVYCSGSGFAGGYGYDKKSAALDSAIRAAGIKLDQSIAGVGDTAIRDAMFAIAKAAKVKRPKLVRAYT